MTFQLFHCGIQINHEIDNEFIYWIIRNGFIQLIEWKYLWNYIVECVWMFITHR